MENEKKSLVAEIITVTSDNILVKQQFEVNTNCNSSLIDYYRELTNDFKSFIVGSRLIKTLPHIKPLKS